MLICVPDVLSKVDVADFRRIMAAEIWEDGRSTAGAQSAEVKQNEQLPPDGETSRKLGRRVVTALTASPLFISAAVPLHIFPPLFNCYRTGKFFGEHVDNCIRGDHLTGPANPHRYLGHPLPVGARRIRRRRTGDRRHLRFTPGEAARGSPRALSGDEPAQGHAGDARRAHQFVLLGAEHDQGRARTAPDVRDGTMRSRHWSSGSDATIPKSAS